ncbi:glycoside hydrolase family 3 protein [Cadophora sp. DSE1049]|nr:glycoside hydrolase family 3 protein [Cadophora sp. DSE1049]
MPSHEDVDIEQLLTQLTLDEKISLLAGANVWETVPIERLNIPSLRVTDGPNGARGSQFFDGTTAACFPACVSIAATFDRALTKRIGKALGQESQTKGAYVLLGPTVCSHRSPLGGRNFEAFSEDPILSGILAAEYVTGLQSERVGATIKHFLGNEQDTRRFSVNELISERALREIYLRPFEIVVKTSDPWCLMTSYPKINGAHVDTSQEFLQRILRQEWGYSGLVMSDWGATTSTVESLTASLDLEMPGKSKWRASEQVKPAIEAGLVSESTINERAHAVLQLLKKTGKFGDRRADIPETAQDLPEHRDLIRQAGAEGIVLLKNEGILPLKKGQHRKVALLGPLAKYAAAHGGGSASLNCHYKVSPFDAFSSHLGSDVDVTYSKGAHIFRVYPDMEEGCKNSVGNPGFTAKYWKNSAFEGEPFHTTHFPRGSFTTLMDTEVEGKLGVRFTTTYTPSKSSIPYLSFSTIGPSKLYIDDVLLFEQPKATKDSMSFLLGVQDELQSQYQFEAGKSYQIRIDTIPSPEPNGELYLLDGQIAAHLGFISQEEMELDVLSEATMLAKEADVAIVFVGNNAQWETEGQDMDDMNLPANGSQDRLIAAVAAANPCTIVVNTTGVAYAGQESRNAIFNVLFGEVNPSGKLPISWPKEYEHIAVYGNFGMDSYESRQVKYVEGVFVGYRHFDRMWGTEKEVRWPFGFGLSYTTFEVTNAAIEGNFEKPKGNGVTVTADVVNTGKVAGSEIVQVYILPPSSGSADHPVKGLVGFEKFRIEVGEKQRVSISAGAQQAAYWHVESRKWKVEAGEYILWLSTSSSPRDKKAELSVKVGKDFWIDP